MTATVTPITRLLAIGQEIRRVREFRDLDAKDLAEYIGRSTAYISRIEKGHRAPTKGDLRNFAELLDVTVEELTNPTLSQSFVLSEDDGPDPNADSVAGDSPRPPQSQIDATSNVADIRTARTRVAEVVQLPFPAAS